ncbi:MAG: hypothetical protein FWD57_08605 [Polyangiaceae bacterium]|nr:hypothetical protein [Polyangiaceae bacterium]
MGYRYTANPNARESVPTPYVDHDDAIVMIGSAIAIRAACLDAAMELGARPVQATNSGAPTIIASTRPLVIVTDENTSLTQEEQADIAISVGAQLVTAAPDEHASDLADRVKSAVEVARAMRNKRRSTT